MSDFSDLSLLYENIISINKCNNDDFKCNRNELELNDDILKHDIIHFDKYLLGNWYMGIYSDKETELNTLIFNHNYPLEESYLL